MELIPKTDFVLGSLWTPEVANRAFEIVFDDNPQFFGHYSKISDEDLSDDVNAIKSRVVSAEDAFKVDNGLTGLDLVVSPGKLLKSDGSILEVPTPLSTTAPSNSVVFLLLDENANLVYDPVALPGYLPLARVTTGSTTVTLIEDLRELGVRRPLSVGGGSSGGGASPWWGDGTQDQEYDSLISDTSGSEYYLRNLSFSGSVYTSQHCTFYCTGDVNIGLGALIRVRSPNNQATQEFYNSPVGLSLPRILSSGAGRTTLSYPWSEQQVGTGGSSGVGYLINQAAGINLAPGGLGGGCLRIFAQGTITIDGTIDLSGQAPIDSPLVGNDPEPNGFGLGIRGLVSGAGGGSGGFLHLRSATEIVIGSNARVILRGGDGGDAIASLDPFDVNAPSYVAHGGGGGAAGHIRVDAPLITGSFIEQVSGDWWGGTPGQYAGHIYDPISNNQYEVRRESGVISISPGLGGGAPAYRTFGDIAIGGKGDASTFSRSSLSGGGILRFRYTHNNADSSDFFESYTEGENDAFF